MEDGLTTIEEKANSEDEDHILLASFKSLDVEMNGAASDGCAKNTHVQLISTDIQTCSDKIDSAPGAVTNASSFEEQSPFCTLFIDRFSCRASLVTGGFLQCVSFLGSAFIKDINGLMPVLGVIGGIGSCMCGTPVPVVISYSFGKHRAKFVTISQVVIGISMFIGSPLAFALLDMYALRGTLLIMAGLGANICVFGMLCKPNEREKSLQRHEERSSRPNELKTKKFQSLLEMCKKFSFMTFLLSTFTWNFVLAIIMLQLPYFISETKTHKDISGVMIIFSISNLAGRILGVLIVFLQNINLQILHVISLAVLGAFVTAFPLYNHLVNSEYVFAAMCGLCTGLPNCLMVPISLQLAGVSRLSAAHGLISFACGVGIVIGPPIASICYKSFGTYNGSFLVAGIVALAGSAFGILTSVFETPKNAEGNILCN
ncbi:monocarboxylate transporter 12-like isoform X2 [Mya arenaria]|uniref:monocarboxylate transporter 12-like isoform X2 n=1 Tax=Mya arenaria TaxID=6604 RepID=UPI0022E50187|nr:monocarboxylate transporter 12-like isoform X2 [Mya arenaria]